MKKLIFAVLFSTIFSISSEAADKGKFKVKVKSPAGAADQINAITREGKVIVGTKSGTTFTVNIPADDLKGSSLYAVNKGRFVGPIFSPSGTKGALYFTKTPTDAKKKKLSSVTLNVKEKSDSEHFLALSKAPKGVVFDKKLSYTLEKVPSLGLNVSAAQNGKKVRGDSDGDGVVDSLDVDSDGDGISNIADGSNDLVTSGISAKAGETIDVPFTTLFLSMNQTLNWHLNGSLSSSAIDSVIGGENKFAIAYFFAIPPENSSGITGGHVICGSDLTYCRPTVGSDTGTAVYSGFSEGNQALQGQLWSNIREDGNEYSLESFTVGGQSEPVFGAAVQPRVGTAAFRPGDNYRVDFTNSSGDVVTSKSLTLPPYFLTVPALKSFNTTSNDASGDTQIDYSNNSGPGNNGNAIAVSSSGDFAGKLRMTVWRLQRLTVSGEETGEYKDFGHLNYGVLINNNAGEFSCGELYSNISSSLTEVSSRGNGGSFASNQGAKLWPLVDSADDYSPSNEASLAGDNTVSFTIDLTACRIRTGLSPGVHTITITAAGADTGHGSNRAAQMVSVNIP